MFTCLADWPLTPEEASLMPPYVRDGIRHHCGLEASHVRWENEAGGIDPHRCHCGAEHDVRDGGDVGRRFEAELVAGRDADGVPDDVVAVVVAVQRRYGKPQS